MGEIAEKIMGPARMVDRYFGPGFPEIVYPRALLVEPDKTGMNYPCEVEGGIYQEGSFSKRRLDLIVKERVLTEFKAISEVDKTVIAKYLIFLK